MFIRFKKPYFMIAGVLGTNELIILFLFIIPVALVIRFIYRYGKQKGKIEELEKRVNDSSGKQ
jgi:hypothetical protein